jgi:hypothetical protein
MKKRQRGLPIDLMEKGCGQPLFLFSHGVHKEKASEEILSLKKSFRHQMASHIVLM